MADYLTPLPVAQVAAWYRRLADRMAREKVDGYEPLASQFLKHWLDNRDPGSTFRFPPPSYLQTNSYVTTVLRYHRRVFLTEERAKIRGGLRWAGVLPRIQGLPGFTKWDLTSSLDIEYESLVEIGNGLADLVRIQTSGTPQERDLLTSLRGFQLKSKVTVTGRRETSGMITIQFFPWKEQVSDRYDWDYSEHFTVPNPDFQSKQPDAVRPGDKTLTVYHSNAQRLEKAGLAAPYNVVSEEWTASDPALTLPGQVDPKKSL